MFNFSRRNFDNNPLSVLLDERPKFQITRMTEALDK